MGFIGFLILAVVAIVVFVFYAGQNSQGETVSFFQYHWHGVPAWVPVVIAVAIVAALFLLYNLIAGTASRLERGRLRKTLSKREEELEQRRLENEQLRSQRDAANPNTGARDATVGDRPVEERRGPMDAIRDRFSGREPSREGDVRDQTAATDTGGAGAAGTTYTTTGDTADTRAAGNVQPDAPVRPDE